MAISSHRKVRELMKNSQINAKDFFTNRVFKSHLEDVATNITKRYRGFRRIRLCVAWDTSDGSPIAFTNNSEVFINAGAGFVRAKDVMLHYKRVLGLFAHELGHVLWTDFVAAHSYTNGLERCLWFPRKPRLVNYEMQVNEQDFWDLALQSSEHKDMLIKYIMQISNILEDGFIEEQIFRTYPGVLGLGLKAVREAHWETIPELSVMVDAETEDDLSKHKLFTMFQVLLMYSKYGEVKCDNVPLDNEHLVMLGKVMPLVDEYMQSPPRERFALTSEIALVMFPLLKDLIEKMLEKENDNQNSDGGNGDSSSQGQPGQGQGSGQGSNQGSGNSQGQSGQGQMSPSQANALSNMLQQVIQGMAGNTQQAQGGTSACASIQSNANSNTQATQKRAQTASQIPSSDEFKIGQAGSGESGDSEGEDGAALGSSSDDGENEGGSEAENQAQGDDGEECGGEIGHSDSSSQDGGKHFDGDGARIGYGEGECEDGQGSGQVDYNDEYEAQLDSNLATKLNSLFDEMKENKAVKTLEGERTRELNSFANDISYGNAHKGIDVRVNRTAEVSEYMEETYKEVAPNFLPIAKNLAKKYLQIADSARQGGRLDGLLMGRKFNAAAAYRTDGKVFMKNIMPQDMQPLAVALLIDESGSMSGTRSEVAMATAIILQNFCEQLKIPMAIYGHSTGSYECELYSYIEFDTYTKKDKYRLTDIGARGCNRDGAALRYTAERLMTRPEEAKLLILISDGQPNGNGGYWGATAEADLRGIQKEYTKKGVCFCAAAIGDDKDIIKGIYGDAFLDISDLNQLPVKLVKVLEKYLHTV